MQRRQDMDQLKIGRFIALCRKKEGLTQMQLAEKLLISTDEPLREVAQASGFADVEYFSRTFKKHHGVSPAAWRKANK